MQTKEDIIKGLNEKVGAFNSFISPMDPASFENTPGGKWSAGQNLEHLIRSMRPLQIAYGVPKFLLKMMFGKTNRPSRTYEELVEKYKSKLKVGGRASGPYIPPLVSYDNKNRLLRKYEKQKNSLIKKIRRQKESDLDLYILPHPLLGKVTLREMLFFTVYHNQHHLELLRNRGA